MLYNKGEGAHFMETYSDKINKIINSPSPTLKKREARKILRLCGVLDNNNQIVDEYKDIIVRSK